MKCIIIQFYNNNFLGKKLPPALDLSNLNDLSPFIPGTERLTEFAIIATSPLVQRAPIKPWDDHRYYIYYDLILSIRSCLHYILWKL